MDQTKQELIEDLPLGADDLIYLILIVMGEKPSAWLQTSSLVWRENDPPKHVTPETRKLIESSMEQLGIAYKIESRVTDAGLNQPQRGRRRWHELLDIFVASDAQTLEKLLAARNSKDWQVLGMVLGYPRTAVEAFAADQRMSVDDLPLEDQLSEAAQFVGFMLSKDHWQDELKNVEEWVNTIKNASPIVYQQYLNRFSNIHRELADRVMQRIA